MTTTFYSDHPVEGTGRLVAMWNQEAAKAAKELAVFKLFAGRVQLPAKPGSIRQDAPDISCELTGGERITFELVTLDSKQSSKTWGDFDTMPGAWNNALQLLPEDRRQSYFERYRHASITPEFRSRPERPERPARMAAMLERLLGQPAGFIGTLDCGEDRIKVEKKPGRSDAHRGPFMLDSLSPTPQAVVWDRIRQKAEKRYKIAGRFELIACSYRDTLFHQRPEDAVPPEADIREWLRDSTFARVWIVEWRFKQIYRRIDRPS
jgi:hypothetical protein